MTKLLISIIVGIISLVLAIFIDAPIDPYLTTSRNSSMQNGNTAGGFSKKYNSPSHDIHTVWFDPRLFVSRDWDISGNGREFKPIKCKNNSEWTKLLSEIPNDVYFRPRVYVDKETGIKIPMMKWRSYLRLPHVRETEYLRNYKADENSIRGNNGFLMTPYLREWQKTNILPNIPTNATLFDIGIGTGRSRELWDAKNATVYGVEPNQDNVNVLLRKNIKSLQVRPWGGEDPQIREWAPKGMFDVVMMSYSITFFFESDDKLNMLLDNVDHLLKPGGVFIIIGMDGNKVKKWIENKSVEDNDLFTIKKLFSSSSQKGKGKRALGVGNQAEEIEITMKSPFSLVESQREYLVDFDKLEKSLKMRRYKLIKSSYVEAPFYLGKWPAAFAESQKLVIFRR